MTGSRAMWIVPIAALTAAGIATALVATMEDPAPPTWNTGSAAPEPPLAVPQVVVEATPEPPELLNVIESACRRRDLGAAHGWMRKLVRSQWPEARRRCARAGFVIEDPP